MSYNVQIPFEMTELFFSPVYLDVYGINMKSLIFKASFSIQKKYLLKNVFFKEKLSWSLAHFSTSIQNKINNTISGSV